VALGDPDYYFGGIPSWAVAGLIAGMSHWSSNASRRTAGVTLLLVATALPSRARAQPEPASVGENGPAMGEPSTQDGGIEAAHGPPPASTTEPLPAPSGKSLSEPRVINVKSPAAASESVHAEEGQAVRANVRWLLNLALVHSSLSGGDFDDSQALIRQTATGAEGVVIPELGSGTGFLVGLGYGLEPDRSGSVGVSTGLNYSATWLSPHSAQTPTPLDAAVLHELELPVRISVQVTRYVRPYLQLSYGFDFLSLSGVHVVGSGTGAQFDSNSILFSGHSLGFEIGTLVRLADVVAVDAAIGFRALTITSVDGAPPPNDLSSGGWTMRIGPMFML
jgi:Outer membrane protein beta-barrel domain